MAERRERWIAGQAGLDPAKLVFIDETATNTKMARRYGRAPIGQRLVGKVPWGHWLTTTFTCGLRCDGLALQLCFDVSPSGGSLMGASPKGPGDDFGGLDLLLSHSVDDTADFLGRPSDQLC